MSEAVEHRHQRAPRESFGKLIDPPLAGCERLLAKNASLAAGYDCQIAGRRLAELAAAARGELVRAAWNYTRTYRNASEPEAAPARVFVAGHQPQLFHPGVWFKNFVLSALAERHAGVGVNLVIDSDTIKTASLRVPSGTAREPHVETIPFDAVSAEIPFETRSILNRDCLKAFGQRASDAIRQLVPDPLVREFWPRVIARADESDNLGLCLAQARHQQEEAWGATTLELPQSSVCSLESFHWFVCHLLAHLPRLREDYNRSVADYRWANRIRSSAHPVPDLAAEEDWLEAPLWIWDRDNPRRRRLFARRRGGEIVLSDRQSWNASIELSEDGDATKAAGQLAELASRGIALRTRALVTTMFARLCLGDVFLHGIGGAKYDQVTDALMERFFGLTAPCYMTITATLRLPIARAEVTLDDSRRVAGQLRELTFHPERNLDAMAQGQVDGVVREKADWINQTPTRETARERCRAIRGANEALQPFVARQREQLQGERDEIARGLRAEQILASRDYAFCLHPAKQLQRLMQV